MRTVFCLLFLLLTGCGQKGQLFLPAEPPAATPVGAPEVTEAPAEEQKDKDADIDSR